MDSVDAKLARAREHLESVEQAVAEFNAGTERTIILKLNPDKSVVSLMTWVKDPYPPIRISTIVGDCAFNMRSALDNLVCGLIRTAAPHSSCASRSFPILTESTKWKDATKSLKGVPTKAQKLIKECQPFNRPPTSIEVDPLHILNVLRNRDTHRAALLTSGFSTNTEFLIHMNDGRRLHVKSNEPMFGEGFHSIPLMIPPSSVGGSTRVESTGKAVLALREEGPWRDRSVVDVLDTCLRYVQDHVVRMFAPFFLTTTP